MKAQHHPFEPARLAALRAYDVLDTPREADFDEIVMLASPICDAPISVINLIDEKRQWFKAETGLGVRETPLDTSLCAHVILEDEFIEIPDTLRLHSRDYSPADRGYILRDFRMLSALETLHDSRPSAYARDVPLAEVRKRATPEDSDDQSENQPIASNQTRL